MVIMVTHNIAMSGFGVFVGGKPCQTILEHKYAQRVAGSD